MGVFVVLWGVGSGLGPALEPMLVGRLFGRKHYASVYGAMDGVDTVVSIPGPWLGGVVFDLFGSYLPVLLLYAAAFLVGGVSFGLLPRFVPSRAATTTPGRTQPGVSTPAIHRLVLWFLDRREIKRCAGGGATHPHRRPVRRHGRSPNEQHVAGESNRAALYGRQRLPFVGLFRSCKSTVNSPVQPFQFYSTPIDAATASTSSAAQTVTIRARMRCASCRPPSARQKPASPSPIPARCSTYDLRRLRLHGLIQRVPHTSSTAFMLAGAQLAFVLSRIYLRLLQPSWPAMVAASPNLPSRSDRPYST